MGGSARRASGALHALVWCLGLAGLLCAGPATVERTASAASGLRRLRQQPPAAAPAPAPALPGAAPAAVKPPAGAAPAAAGSKPRPKSAAGAPPQRPAAAPAAGAPAAGAGAPAGAPAAAAPARQGLAPAPTSQAAGPDPPCKWDADDGSCNPTHAAWLLVAGRPSSPYRRAVLMAAARDKHCARHKSAAACGKDAKRRCFWQAAGAGNNASSCQSSDMQELLLFAARNHQPSVSLIPHSLTCPGSAARAFFECYAFAGSLGACRALPQCMVLASFGAAANMCVPKSWQKQTVGQARLLLRELEDLSPRAYGSCAAACWLQQSKACSGSSSREACRALPFCTYLDPEADKRAKANIWGDDSDSDSDGSGGDAAGDDAADGPSSRVAAGKAVKPTPCRRQAQEFAARNPVDQAAKQVYKLCRAAVSETACQQVAAPPAPAPRPAAAAAANASRWVSYEPSAAAVKCALPAPPAPGAGSAAVQAAAQQRQ